MAETPKTIDHINITPTHEQLVRHLFLARWERIEPELYTRLWVPYADTDASELVFDAHKYNLQEQNRFPSDRYMYRLADEILQQKDQAVRAQMIHDFLAQPDVEATPPTRVDRTRRGHTDESIAS